MGKEILVYCDESAKKGPHFSNFYGASIVLSEHVHLVESKIRQSILNSGLTCEVKWNNISPSTEGRFCDIASTYFEQIRNGNVRFRAMFTHNVFRPIGLTNDHIRQQYFLLYYQFIKNGLGLKYYRNAHGPRDIRLIFDQFPQTGSQVYEFRQFLLALNKDTFSRNGLCLKNEKIGEARSHDHPILQCTDLVLGSIQFKLNGLDKIRPEGKARRGKKTRSKERVYRHILTKIQEIYPHFNIGISTGHGGDIANRWNHSFRHWKLVPENHTYDESAEK